MNVHSCDEEEDGGPDTKSVLSRHQKVFVMGRDLLGTNKVLPKLNALHASEDNRMSLNGLINTSVS